MSLKKVNLRGIGPRLVVWSTLLLAVSLLIVSATVYYLLSSSMRKSDQDSVRHLAQNLKKDFEVKGILPASHYTSDTFVVLLDSNNKITYNSLDHHQIDELDDKEDLVQINEHLTQKKSSSGWETILLVSGNSLELKLREFVLKKEMWGLLPLIDNDIVEVYSLPLAKGGWLKVGRSSEEREERLGEIRYISLMVIIPFIFMGLLLSIILARSILSPLKELVTTIQKIKAGDSTIRVRLQRNGDEVDKLAAEFNELIDLNTKLVANLKNTIDNVAHDLRTPLTRFRASAEYALGESTNVDVLKEALHDGIENSDRILSLLNAIMDATESETGLMKLRIEDLEVAELINGLVDLYHYSAEDKHIKFLTNLTPGLFIKGDRTRLSQALGNIIDNALKFSPVGSSVEITITASEGHCLIAFADQGPGIGEQELERIWERLFRGDKSRSTPGLGIGLSVVKAIVSAHQGRVWVESDKGAGATFFVSLPLRNAAVRGV